MVNKGNTQESIERSAASNPSETTVQRVPRLISGGHRTLPPLLVMPSDAIQGHRIPRIDQLLDVPKHSHLRARVDSSQRHRNPQMDTNSTLNLQLREHLLLMSQAGLDLGDVISTVLAESSRDWSASPQSITVEISTDLMKQSCEKYGGHGKAEVIDLEGEYNETLAKNGLRPDLPRGGSHPSNVGEEDQSARLRRPVPYLRPNTNATTQRGLQAAIRGGPQGIEKPLMPTILSGCAASGSKAKDGQGGDRERVDIKKPNVRSSLSGRDFRSRLELGVADPELEEEEVDEERMLKVAKCLDDCEISRTDSLMTRHNVTNRAVRILRETAGLTAKEEPRGRGQLASILGSLQRSLRLHLTAPVTSSRTSQTSRLFQTISFQLARAQKVAGVYEESDTLEAYEWARSQAETQKSNGLFGQTFEETVVEIDALCMSGKRACLSASPWKDLLRFQRALLMAEYHVRWALEKAEGDERRMQDEVRRRARADDMHSREAGERGVKRSAVGDGAVECPVSSRRDDGNPPGGSLDIGRGEKRAKRDDTARNRPE